MVRHKPGHNMSRGMQEFNINRMIANQSRHSTDTIDVHSLIDPSLRLDENMRNIKRHVGVTRSPSEEMERHFVREHERSRQWGGLRPSPAYRERVESKPEDWQYLYFQDIDLELHSKLRKGHHPFYQTGHGHLPSIALPPGKRVSITDKIYWNRRRPSSRRP